MFTSSRRIFSGSSQIPICARCKQGVDSVDIEEDPLYLQVTCRCHGDTVTTTFPRNDYGERLIAWFEFYGPFTDVPPPPPPTSQTIYITPRGEKQAEGDGPSDFMRELEEA